MFQALILATEGPSTRSKNSCYYQQGAQKVENYAHILWSQSGRAIQLGSYHKYALFKITDLGCIQCGSNIPISQAPLVSGIQTSLGT